MVVNLTNVFTREGQVQQLEASYDADVLTNRLGVFPIKEKSPVVLQFFNKGQSKVLVEGHTTVTVIFACDRCLENVDHTFDLSFAYEVVSPDASENSSDEEGLCFMEGYYINVDSLINNEILLNWPMKVLCRLDCKGICKVCGKNLNEGDCDCDDFVPDPRMAAIKDIFNANKEV